MCSHPMVQATQLARVRVWVVRSSSGEMLAAPSNVPLWKLRVGNAPRRLNVSRLVAVPSSRYLAVAGPNDRFDRFLLYSVNSRGWAHSQRRVPRTARALTFLLPSTAPLPPRPAWRPSWEIVAKRTACSPAGPIEAI